MTKIPKLRCSNPTMHCESVPALSERFLAPSNAPDPQYSAPSRTGERLHTIKCTRTATRRLSLEHIATYLYEHTYTRTQKSCIFWTTPFFVKYRDSSRYESWMEMLHLGLRKHARLVSALNRMLNNTTSISFSNFFFFFSDYENTNNVGLLRLL